MSQNSTPMGLVVHEANRCFGQHHALSQVSFQLETGEIGVMMGSSGSGKTTLLRSIAGLEQLHSGAIKLEGDVLQDGAYSRASAERDVGLVFQDHALFPHLSVAENIAFGLHRLEPQERQLRVNKMLSLIGLNDRRDARPDNLSGGQQQRVALARALAPQPRVLLLDEPFASLDLRLRRQLASELRDLLKSLTITSLIVTHDPEEAFALADRAGVMHEGRLLQWSTPYQLYHQPHSRRVAEFVAPASFLPIEPRSDGRWQCELGVLPDTTIAPDAKEIMLRPDDILHRDESTTRAEIKSRVFRGADFLYTLALPSGREVLAQVPSHHDHPVGSLLGVELDLDHVVAF